MTDISRMSSSVMSLAFLSAAASTRTFAISADSRRDTPSRVWLSHTWSPAAPHVILSIAWRKSAGPPLISMSLTALYYISDTSAWSVTSAAERMVLRCVSESPTAVRSDPGIEVWHKAWYAGTAILSD